MDKPRIKVYSAITDSKDKPRVDNVQTFTEYDKFTEPVRNAKIYKVLPHLFLETEYSIWIDGNITLNKTPEELIELLGDKDIAVLPNPYRTKVEDELNYCILHEIGVVKDLETQKERYLDKKPICDLMACGIIIRRHTEEMKSLCEKWWAEICAGSARDQISFPYVFPQDKITVLPFQGNFLNNEFFSRVGHNKQ